MRRKAPNMSAIAINYDERFDVLYLRLHKKDSVYGDENDTGVVTLRRVDDDTVAGMIVYDFRKQYMDGVLNLDGLPIPIDENLPDIARILK